MISQPFPYINPKKNVMTFFLKTNHKFSQKCKNFRFGPDVVTGGQAGEDFTHRVEVHHGSLLGRHAVPLVHPEPVAEELVVEELVDNEYLGDDNEQVGRLTAVEEEGVSVVLVVEVLLECPSQIEVLNYE